MGWSSVGSFYVNNNEWSFGSTNLDIDASLCLKLEYEQTVPVLDVYGLIADVYFDTTLSFSKPLIADVRPFYPSPKGSQLIVFDPPGRFQDPGENVDLPGGFIWEFDIQTNSYELRKDVWRRIGFKRGYKKKGFKKKVLKDSNGVPQGFTYPWLYQTQHDTFRVFVDVFV